MVRDVKYTTNISGLSRPRSSFEFIMARKRILKELGDITNDPPPGCSAGLENEDDDFTWRVTMKGPEGTPYEGGVFLLRVQFPKDYPFRCPIVKFITRIYHPNIDNNGNICTEIFFTKWSPTLTVSRVLLWTLSLLADPRPDDPYVPDRGRLYKTDIEKYMSEAREFTRKYAT